MLPNRFKMVMPKIVSKAQSAFVEGRKFLDAALMANEMVDSILRSNKGFFFV